MAVRCLAGRTARALLAAVSLAAAALHAPSAATQSWAADVALGHAAHDFRAGPVHTLGAQLGVRMEGPWWLYAAAGLPFDDGGVPWAGGGAGTRLTRALGGGTAGLDVAAQGFGYADRQRDLSGAGAVLELLPLLVLPVGDAQVEVRSGAVHYARDEGGASSSRTAHQSDVRAFFGGDRITAYAEGRVVRVDGGAHPFAGGGVETEVRGASVWAHAGRWFADGIARAAWGAGVRVPFGPAAEAFAAVRQETNDPLFREPPRRSWTLGVSRRLGAARPPAPLEALAPVAAGRRVTFRLSGRDAREAPSIAGDFTGWKPVAMARDGGGWAATLDLPAGAHRYAFRRADGTWFVPPGTPGRRDDGMGGVSAVVVVP